MYYAVTQNENRKKNALPRHVGRVRLYRGAVGDGECGPLQTLCNNPRKDLQTPNTPSLARLNVTDL